MARREITVEGPSIKACRTQAATELKVDAGLLRADVLQYGKQGFFSNKPYRVRFFIPSAESTVSDSTSGASGKIDLYLAMIQADLEHLDKLDQSGERPSFDELLAHFDDLGEDLQGEVKELAALMSGVGGTDARRVIEAVSRDGQFEVTVDADNMRATMKATPPEGEGKAVTLSDVMQHLQDRGIRQGVDHVAIRKALDDCQKDGEIVADILIARGIEARHGEDGALQLMFSMRDKEILIDKKDQADYRGKARFAQVNEGDLLVRIKPPTEGSAGVDIFGEPVPATPGQPVTVETGQNVERSEDGLEIHSKINGVAEYADNRVYVRPLVLIEGDVDMKTGNIEFEGEVEVRGNVKDHFSVRAGGNIMIHGRVEGSEVVSTGGGITIRQGVAGHERCYISSGKSVEARYIENATVYAAEDVTVERAILNSKVVAGGSVVAERGKGMIAGGATYAALGVTAKFVGNVNEPPTRVVLGISMEDYRRIEGIDHQIASLQHTLGKIDLLLGQITNYTRDLSALPLQKRREFVLLKKQTIVSRAKLQKLHQEKSRLEQQTSRDGSGLLTVHNTLYGKVSVEMAGCVYHNENERDRVVLEFDPEKKEIIIRGHK